MSKKMNREPMNPDRKPRADVGDRDRKKALVLGIAKKSRTPLYAVLGVVALLAIGGILYMTVLRGDQGVVAATGKGTNTGQTVTHPASLFDDGKARHFQYDDGNGLKVRYFVLKSSDGVIRAAFDACDVCWPAGKGYFQAEDVMVCRNCGRQFASVLVNEVKGGCNPAPLNREIVDGQVVLQIADIVQGGKAYFDFSTRG